LQLTHLRNDEIRMRIAASNVNKIPEQAMGPILMTRTQEEQAIPIMELLAGIQVQKMRKETVRVSPINPNYLIRTQKNLPARSQEIRELIEEIAGSIWNKYGVMPKTRYDYIGVW